MFTITYKERSDVIIETAEECLRALLDGFVLESFSISKTNKLKLVDGYIMDLYDGMGLHHLPVSVGYKVFEEIKTPWYETVTFPVLCWIDDKKDYPVLIKGYEKEDSLVQFISAQTKWFNAVPITPTEFEKLNGQFKDYSE